MASRFWNFVLAMVPGSLAKAEDVNDNLSGIDTALALIETEMDGAIRVTTSPGDTAILENAASRANKLIQFNSAGGVELGTVVGDWQGDHADAAGTDYYVRDVVRDAAAAIGLNNLYICTTAHTSTGDILTDTANWSLLIDVTDSVTAQLAAEAAQTAAEAAQTAAELALDSFDDRYLGAKAANPTLDNDGDALITGATYFNSVANVMRVYTSAASWADINASGVPVLLESQTANNDTSIDFTTNIDSTYDHYYIEMVRVKLSLTSTSFRARLSHASAFNSSTVYWTAGTLIDYFRLVQTVVSMNTFAMHGTVHIYNGAGDTQELPSGYSDIHLGGNSTGQVNQHRLSYNVNNINLDGIQFFCDTGLIVSGTFKLFGVPK